MTDQVGKTLKTRGSGHPFAVKRLLGEGTQGAVYEVDLGGRGLAFKHYHPAFSNDRQLAVLEGLIKRGPPTSRFLWPMELAEADGRIGYLMALREPRFAGMADLMHRRAEPSFRALVQAGFELAHSFLQLHAEGLCYRDINFENVFFDPASGEVAICDNDNCGIDGQPASQVQGTLGFMAPELVRREAHPSADSDRFSLALLLFYMLMIAHPLEGRREAEIHCLDLPARERLYGFNPLFIFDPDDAGNRPVPGIHDNAIAFWEVYPGFLRELFVQSFTRGLHDPKHGRVRETQWRTAMLRLLDGLLYCGHCRAENFYDGERLKAGEVARCWSCGAEIKPPARIRMGDQVVMLNHDSRLYARHLGAPVDYDFGQVVAEMVENPAKPGAWGLCNRSETTWNVSPTDKPAFTVAPGKTLPLRLGVKIGFGPVTGEIRL